MRSRSGHEPRPERFAKPSLALERSKSRVGVAGDGSAAHARLMRPLAFALLLVASLVACGQGRGDKRMGDACESDRECARGYCVSGVSGEGEDPVCTRSCARTEDCPREWSCSAVTSDQVLVCTHGAPTPFGIGARE